MLIKATFKSKLFFALAGCALVFSVFGYSVYGKNQLKENTEPEALQRPVKHMVLKKSLSTNVRVFPGMVNVAGETKLAFRVNGTLQKIDVRIGQRVKKDEIIAHIDPRDFKINLIRLQASLEEAKASLSAMEKGARQEDINALTAQVNAGHATFINVQKQKSRYDKLIDSQFITKAQYDQVSADFETSRANYNVALQNLEKAKNGARPEDIQAAKARIKQLKANISAAEFALKDTTLKAPFGGIINEKLAENYETISAGQPVVTILDYSSTDIKTAIPEEILVNRNAFTKITCTIDAYPKAVFNADIKEIGLKTNTANQSFPLTVSLKNAEGIDIKAGMTASVKIEYSADTTQDLNGFFVPNGAVFLDTENHLCAWKINIDTLKVSKVQIISHQLKGNKVFISSELQEDDLIVTAGAKFLIQNQKVTLLNS
jgi:membrane fusion protein, multidrug efflux system